MQYDFDEQGDLSGLFSKLRKGFKKALPALSPAAALRRRAARQRRQSGISPAIRARLLGERMRHDSGLLGSLEAGEQPPSWMQSLTPLLTAVVSAEQQRKLAKINLARAQRGEPPLDAAAVAPAVKVKAELPDEVKALIRPAKIAVVVGGSLYLASKLGLLRKLGLQ